MAFVFAGTETPGLDRLAAFFFDGIFVRYAMVVDHTVAVFDTAGKLIYQELGAKLPDGFVPKSAQAFRSRQTGKLVVGFGGFYPGTSKQLGVVFATDYFVQE